MSYSHDMSHCWISCSPKNRSSKSTNPLLCSLPAMTSGQHTTKRSTDVAAKSRRWMLNPVQEQLPLPDAMSSSDICTYWASNAAFDPHSVLLRRHFFINGDKMKYVSDGFYPARESQPVVEFGAIGRGGSKSFILTDKQAYTLAECLPKLHESLCKEGRTKSLGAKAVVCVYCIVCNTHIQTTIEVHIQL